LGDKFHPKLNISRMPIANKYREGKMKRTLERELKVPEIAEGEAVETDFLSNGRPLVGRLFGYGGRCTLVDGCAAMLVFLLREGTACLEANYRCVIGFVCFGWPVLKHGPRSLTYMRV
jgi:hypothetical protein